MLFKSNARRVVWCLCNFVVFTIVWLCVDNRGVYVFHVCVVSGVGICGDVCGVVWVVKCCLFHESGSGLKRVHVVLPGMRMRLFICVHVCILCRYD